MYECRKRTYSFERLQSLFQLFLRSLFENRRLLANDFTKRLLDAFYSLLTQSPSRSLNFNYLEQIVR